MRRIGEGYVGGGECVVCILHSEGVGKRKRIDCCRIVYAAESSHYPDEALLWMMGMRMERLCDILYIRPLYAMPCHAMLRYVMLYT